jgi:hypothetical protein
LLSGEENDEECTLMATTDSNHERPRPVARFGGIAAVLALCGTALFLVSRSQLWPQTLDVRNNPAGPLLLGLRVILGLLALWVGSMTILTLIAHRSGHHRQAARLNRLLPQTVQRAVRAAIGVGLTGALLFNSSALAAERTSQRTTQHQTNSREATAEQASAYQPNQQPVQQPNQQLRGWPIAKGPIIVVDDDVPVLVVRGTPLQNAPVITGTPPTSITSSPGSIPELKKGSQKREPRQGATRDALAGRPSLPQGTIAAATSPTLPVSAQPALDVTTPAAAKVSSTPVLKPTTSSSVSPRVYVVKPGDHFWSIAEAEVKSAAKGEVTEADVASYWVKLVELNRKSLPDPTNPDVLLMGASIYLP